MDKTPTAIDQIVGVLAAIPRTAQELRQAKNRRYYERSKESHQWRWKLKRLGSLLALLAQPARPSTMLFYVARIGADGSDQLIDGPFTSHADVDAALEAAYEAGRHDAFTLAVFDATEGS